MGQICGAGLSPEAKRDRQIAQAMRKAQMVDDNKIKLLLLGAGESGKSTFFKQMKLLYTDKKDFTPEERTNFRRLVYANIVSDMQTMVRAVLKTAEFNPELGFTSKKGMKATKAIMGFPKKPTGFSEADVKALSRAWKDPGMTHHWNNRGNIQVQDSLEYFMKKSNLKRVAEPEYSPTNQDILRTRARTTGIITETFKVDNNVFEMCDVGGQRNERKKWISAFDGVTSVIFIAAASEYNQVLYEDVSVNRQDESLKLFGEMVAERAFAGKPFILFLNKEDLLREKLASIPFKLDNGIERRNTNYQGIELSYNRTYDYSSGTDGEFEAHLKDVEVYLEGLFLSQIPYVNNKPVKLVKVYFTNSTDGKNIYTIINACKQILMSGYLADGGWLDGAL